MPTKKATKKKSRKMDSKLVSSELHELKYVAKKKKVPLKKVKQVKKEVGRSRKKINKALD